MTCWIGQQVPSGPLFSLWQEYPAGQLSARLRGLHWMGRLSTGLRNGSPAGQLAVHSSSISSSWTLVSSRLSWADVQKGRAGQNGASGHGETTSWHCWPSGQLVTSQGLRHSHNGQLVALSVAKP